MTVISAPSLLVDGELRGPGAVVIDEGRIVEVLPEVPRHDREHVRLGAGVLTAGMLDLQVNGAFGTDFGLVEPSAWGPARRAILGTGVTSILPTLVTSPLEVLVSAMEQCSPLVQDALPDSARVLGVHVEGPFLSPDHRGAHDGALLLEPLPHHIDLLLAAGRHDALAILTLAPELPGALDAVRSLVAAGVVVSVGHTGAEASVVHAAADAGASMITHLFNAQRGLHHREPGVPGAALADPRYRLGLIADGHHIADDVVRLAFAAAGPRMVLVTDAVAAAGLPPGTTTLGGEPVVVARAGEPPRRLDGTLAGSCLTLDRAVRNVVALGVERAVALLAATRTPADVLGRQDLGRIAVGALADLVHWDDDLVVRSVWLGGAARSHTHGADSD